MTVCRAQARPPREGEPSYERFAAEKAAVLDSLKLRARMIAEAFNSMQGFTCNVVQVPFTPDRAIFNLS